MAHDSEMDFDRDAYIVTTKSLCIIFILIILFSNALLIYKNVRKLDFYTRPKNQIIISMAIGDIFFALFPLVVFTEKLFGDSLADYTRPGRLTMLSGASEILIHFVYGLGICVLGIELIFRNKIHNMTDSKTSKIFASFALSSFPWLLGLIVVLPLCLANWDPKTCENTQSLGQWRAAPVISVILPACAAVIICIVINCCVFTSTRYRQQTVTSQPMVIVSTSTSSSQMQSGNGYTAPPSQGYYPAQQYPLQPYPHQMNNPQANQPYVSQQPYTTAQPYPQAQPCPATQPLIAALPYTIGEQNKDVDLQNFTGNNLSNVYREKSRLLVIAIIFFLLVVPQAIFAVSYYHNRDRTELNIVARVAIGSFLTWTMNMRSFITPLIMYCYSDDI